MGDPIGLDALLLALRRLTPMPPDPEITPVLLRAYRDVVERIARVAAEDPRAIAALLASLGPGEGKGAFERVIELAEGLPVEVAGPMLVRALERGGRGTRRWAAVALGRLGYAPAIPALSSAVEDQDPLIRKTADLALRMIRSALPEEPPERDDETDPLFEGIAE